MAGPFFRIIRTGHAAWSDFLSNQVMDQPPRGKEIDDTFEWSSISVFDDPTSAMEMARTFQIGRYIAELQLADDAPIVARPDPDTPNHWTLLGGPGVFVRHIVAIRRVRG